MLAACSGASMPGNETAEAREVGVLTIEAGALATRIEAGEPIQLIDVRTPEEFAEGHLAGAINIPVDQFDPAALPATGGAERVLYCRSARRSAVAAEALSQASGSTAVHLEGGILAWEEAGLPVTR